MSGDAGARARVLIVDDAAFMRTIMRDILSGSGRYDVVAEAVDGRDAVRAFERVRPDLVMLDLVMPEMTGIEAARTILTINPAARIVACSALGQEDLVIASIQAGARDVILKPYSPDRVLDVLDQVMAAP